MFVLITTEQETGYTAVSNQQLLYIKKKLDLGSTVVKTLLTCLKQDSGTEYVTFSTDGLLSIYTTSIFVSNIWIKASQKK